MCRDQAFMFAKLYKVLCTCIYVHILESLLHVCPPMYVYSGRLLDLWSPNRDNDS